MGAHEGDLQRAKISPPVKPIFAAFHVFPRVFVRVRIAHLTLFLALCHTASLWPLYTLTKVEWVRLKDTI